MNQVPVKLKSKKILAFALAFGLFILGIGFSMSIALWIHEGGHVIGALITGSQINEINLWLPWDGHVNASYSSIFARCIFFVGGFAFTVFLFTLMFTILVFKKSKLAYFMLFPLFQVLPSSQGDLIAVGVHIPDIIINLAFGWILPISAFFVLWAYFNGLTYKTSPDRYSNGKL